METESSAKRDGGRPGPTAIQRLRRCAWRTTTTVWRVAVASLLAGAMAAPAWAAQTDITISMDKPPAAPRINGATLIGAIPGSPFLHTISATGQAPLTFAATGLPSGLAIDAGSGTISGTTPAAGSYPIDVTVSNSVGSAGATLTLTAGSTLALTPPMGWNSYDSFYQNVTENDVKAAAQALKTYLQPYGGQADIAQVIRNKIEIKLAPLHRQKSQKSASLVNLH